MRSVSPQALATSRRLQSQASFTALELRANQLRKQEAVNKARLVLSDALLACGLPDHERMAVKAAAESLVKAAVSSRQVAMACEHSEGEGSSEGGGE